MIAQKTETKMRAETKAPKQILPCSTGNLNSCRFYTFHLGKSLFFFEIKVASCWCRIKRGWMILWEVVVIHCLSAPFLKKTVQYDKSPAFFSEARELAAKVMDGKIVVGHSLQNDFQVTRQ